VELEFFGGPQGNQNRAGYQLSFRKGQHGPGVQIAGDEPGKIIRQIPIKFLPEKISRGDFGSLTEQFGRRFLGLLLDGFVVHVFSLLRWFFQIESMNKIRNRRARGERRDLWNSKYKASTHLPEVGT